MSTLTGIIIGALITLATGHISFLYQKKLIKEQFNMEKEERLRAEEKKQTETLRVERRNRILVTLEKIIEYYSEFHAMSTLLDFTNNESLESDENYIRYMKLENLLAINAVSLYEGDGPLSEIMRKMQAVDEKNIQARRNFHLEIMKILREEINRLSK